MVVEGARRHDRRRAVVLAVTAAAFALAALLLAGCDTGPIELAVTSPADGRDLVPGDGWCEVTAGAGDCTLRAAIDEANASGGPAVVTIPSGAYALTLTGTDDLNAGGDLDVAAGSRVVVRAEGEGAAIDASAADGGFDVRSGELQLERVAVLDAGGPAVAVRSGATVALVRTTLAGSAGPGLEVAAGAEAGAVNLTVSSNGGPGVQADGPVNLVLATVTGNHGGIAGTTSPTLTASIVGAQAAGADCAVAAVSNGGNLDQDGTCALGAAQDGTGDPRLGPLAGAPLPVHPPGPRSPAIDALTHPACGSPGVDVDERGTARPTGGPCDRGAVELEPLALVVDDPGDSVDAAPGDGRCADAADACTLRAAVIEANTSGSPDTITVAPGIDDVALTLAGVDEDDARTGDLDVLDDLTIDGGGVRITAPGLDVTSTSETGTTCIPLRGCFQYIEVVEHFGLDAVLHVGDGARIRVEDVAVADLEVRDAVVDVAAGATAELAAVTVGDVHADVAVVRSAGDLSIASSSVVGGAGDPYCDLYSPAFALCGRVSGRGLGSAGVQVDGGQAAVADTTVTGFADGVRVGGGAATVERALVTAEPTAAPTDEGWSRRAAVRQTGGTATVTASTLLAADGVDQSAGTLALAGATVEGLDGHAVRSGAWVVAAGSWFGGPCATRPTSLGFLADDDGSCAGAQPTDRPAVPALLAPLADNGGPTRSRLPAANSPLVDAVPSGTPGLCDATASPDQRGTTRPVGAACDIGAVEGTGPVVDVPLTLVVDAAGDADDVRPGDSTCRTSTGACTLRAAISEANARPAADSVTFAADIDRVTLSIDGTDEDRNTTGDLDVLGDVRIDGAGRVTVDADGTDRVLHHHAGDLRVDGLAVTGGALDDDGAAGGGVLVESGSVALTGVDLRGNRLDGAGATGAGLAVLGGAVTVDASALRENLLAGPHAAGGAGHLAGGTLDVRATTVADNRATDPTGAGGGLAVGAGTATLEDSTFIGNEAGAGAALLAGGGAIDATYVTVAGNRGAESVAATAGGLTMRASIIDAPGPACSAPVASAGHNVVTDSTCGAVAPGDREEVDPRLGPAGDHGGIGETRPPSQYSTFEDAIPAGTVGLCDGTEGPDQVGASRPGAVAGCTAGAVEDVALASLDLVVDDAGDEADVAPGDGACATAGGSCTLRAAVDESNADPFPDRILVGDGIDPVLAPGGAGDDANASGDLDVLAPVTIEGRGATLHASGLDRALDVAVDPVAGPVTIDELHVTGGGGVARGAGLLVRRGEVEVLDAHVHHNVASATTGAATGGGVAVDATATSLTVSGATFEANEARSAPSAPSGGAIDAAAPLTVTRSTFVGNGAIGTFGANGGAVRASGAGASITASTLTDNVAVLGRGVYASSAPVVLAAVILDNGADCGTGGFGGSVTSWYGVDEAGTCTSSTDVTGVDPGLGPLADLGGPTPVRPLLSGSPAIELVPVGATGCTATDPTTDQLGQPRPRGGRCDAGAVEGDPAGSLTQHLVVDTAVDGDDAAPGDRVCAAAGGGCTLRAAISETNATPYRDEITIAAGVDPVLSIPRGPYESGNANGSLYVGSELVVHGQGATVDGAGLDLVVYAYRPLELHDLTITGGANPYVDGTRPGEGGGITATDDLTLDRVTVTGNHASTGGGVRFFGRSGTSARLVVRDSTIAGNTAALGGGLYFFSQTGAAHLIERTTFDANTATASGGNLYHYLGGLELRAVTVTGGTANLGAGIWSAAGYGSDLHLSGSIVDNVGDDCWAPLTSGGWNLGSDASCPFTGPGDQRTVDPQLGPLADHGGPTRTRLPGLGSPVLDVIPAGTPGLCDASVVADQRARPRPAGAACDVGAVERQPGDP